MIDGYTNFEIGDLVCLSAYGEADLWSEGERFEHSFEANDNSIEQLD